MCAFLILHPGRDISLEELVQFLEARKSRASSSRNASRIVDGFPVSAFGKVSKKTLVETISGKLADEANG